MGSFRSRARPLLSRAISAARSIRLSGYCQVAATKIYCTVARSSARWQQCLFTVERHPSRGSCVVASSCIVYSSTHTKMDYEYEYAITR